ncbi:MAG: hypothetical protein F6K56_33265, partial [Moorea sp. SIO3G5]|nr:hypothetical protein [Moorena sp. SIO3G5]
MLRAFQFSFSRTAQSPTRRWGFEKIQQLTLILVQPWSVTERYREAVLPQGTQSFGEVGLLEPSKPA